jgi:hypothetical protein
MPVVRLMVKALNLKKAMRVYSQQVLEPRG